MKLLQYCLVATVLVLECALQIAALAKLETPLIYKQKRVRFLDEKKNPSTKSNTRWEPLSDSVRSSSTSEISSSRRACGFYVWNAASASMYHLCRYLMRDAVFEGQGGKRFVRIEPGSLLELLYPASRHSPDKCIFCGGSFADHMILRWSKHIYSPYDLYMDRTYSDGVLQKVSVSSSSTPAVSSRAVAGDEPTKRYAFHTRYVHDLGLLFQGISGPRNKIRKLKQKISEDPYLSDPAVMKKRGDTVFVVPSIAPKKKRNVGRPLLRFARNRVLEAVDRLIDIQNEEYNQLKTQSAMSR